jgi:CheY-like chemotaxis protein
MIYFVDDDVNQMRPFRDELEEHGYSIKALRNADEALLCLKQVDDIELVIMDVMIGTGPSESSAFNRAETDDFLITGLVLIDKLMKANESKFSKNMVIFSMAHQPIVTERIKERAEKFHINYLRKSDYADPYKFCKKLAELGLIELKF